MTMTSDDQAFIEGVRARCEAATDGQWVHETQMFDEGPDTIFDVHGEEVVITSGGGIDDFNNADFIANARQDIPWLLSTLTEAWEALQAERERVQVLTEAVTGFVKWIDTPLKEQGSWDKQAEEALVGLYWQADALREALEQAGQGPQE